MRDDAELVVVNPDNEDSAFRERISRVFPSVRQVTIDGHFVAFCESLLTKEGARDFRKRRADAIEAARVSSGDPGPT